jgi:uncharacterized peroxidase-related enzyme
MAFIETVRDEDAADDVRRMYDEEKKVRGYLPNYARVFSPRPHVKEAWNNLQKSIKSTMDTRRFELVTIAAAKALSSSYCMLAHGALLLKQFYGPAELASIASDYRSAGLTEAEVAMMAFAEKIVKNASSVTRDDIARLRALGFSDPEIFDVTVTATARCFFSKTLDALGAEPDSVYLGIEENVRHELTVGRCIEGETAR